DTSAHLVADVSQEVCSTFRGMKLEGRLSSSSKGRASSNRTNAEVKSATATPDRTPSKSDRRENENTRACAHTWYTQPPEEEEHITDRRARRHVPKRGKNVEAADQIAEQVLLYSPALCPARH
ncbi:unnamed protein product, partial [Scytosiphon promiscuus]